MALRQVHAKKVLAGSTSAQLGLMIAATGAGFPGIAMLHLIVHAAIKAALFFAAGIAQERVGSFDLRRMRLGRAMPLVAVLTAVAALSLAAVPPLSGGWSKEEVVEGAGPRRSVARGLGMVAGGLSAAYAARFAVMAYGPGERDTEERDSTSDTGNSEMDGRETGEPARAELLALASMALATLALSALWLPPAHEAAAALLGATLPGGSRLELAASLAAVGLGSSPGSGWRGSRRDPPRPSGWA